MAAVFTNHMKSLCLSCIYLSVWFRNWPIGSKVIKKRKIRVDTVTCNMVTGAFLLETRRKYMLACPKCWNYMEGNFSGFPVETETRCFRVIFSGPSEKSCFVSKLLPQTQLEIFFSAGIQVHLGVWEQPTNLSPWFWKLLMKNMFSTN